MTAQLPPIHRDCRRLLLHTKEVVSRFSRYHKYTVIPDLRQQAIVLMRDRLVVEYGWPKIQCCLAVHQFSISEGENQ